jgi:hypothetical protein
MLLNINLVGAVRDCVTRGVDDLCQSGLTDARAQLGRRRRQQYQHLQKAQQFRWDRPPKYGAGTGTE